MKLMMFNDRLSLTDLVINTIKERTSRDELKNAVKVIEQLNTCCLYEDSEGYRHYHKYRYQKGEVVAVSQCYYDAETGWIHLMMDKDKNYVRSKLKEVQELTRLDINCAGKSNKMFVKSSLMPYRIEITDIIVQRLQDISDEDCMKEGILIGDFINTWDKYYYDIIADCVVHKTFKTPREAFSSLINTINRGIWERNPFVVVYYFKYVRQ